MFTTAAALAFCALAIMLAVALYYVVRFHAEAEEERERADRLEASLDAQDGRIAALQERIAQLQHRMEGSC